MLLSNLYHYYTDNLQLYIYCTSIQFEVLYFLMQIVYDNMGGAPFVPYIMLLSKTLLRTHPDFLMKKCWICAFLVL